MKLGLWLRLLWCVGAYCGCGGSEFLVGVFPDGGPAPELVDAGAVLEDAEAQPKDVGSRSSGRSVNLVADSGDPARVGADASAFDAPAEVDSPAPAADSGAKTPPAGDAADEPPPPPPALCCLTPCSGSSVAPIACGNGPAWECAAGSCAARACAVGAVCHWMGVTCTGSVGVCP